LCICHAIGPGFPADTFEKRSISIAAPPTGCATVIRAVPFDASASISTRLHSCGSNRVCVVRVNSSLPALFIPGR
jgi:hypothetical protein